MIRLFIRHCIFFVRNFFKKRGFAMLVLMACFFFSGFFLTKNMNTVCITDGEKVTFVRTTENEYTKILDEAEINTRQEDGIDFDGFDKNYGEMDIERSFPITITADGSTREEYVLSGTVDTTLEKIGLSLGSNDIINVDLNDDINEEDHIVINRVDMTTRQETEIIPHDVVVTPSSKVLAGIVSVEEPGLDGAFVKTFEEKYVDGVLEHSVLISEELTQEPITEYQIKGTIPSASPFEAFAGIELDDTGRPSNYVNILENQVATAYSARSGAKTASGRYAIVGHVAVDPRVIPYGSKLFIETTGGAYVYGYAIAADTGTALLDGRVDVDLFFDNNAECRAFGKKSVRIYILP